MILLMVGVVFLGWMAFANGLGSAPKALQKESTEKLEPAPDFTLPDLKGKKVTLSQYRGKVVFLNFWATWCPPCRAEMPSMQKLYDTLKTKKQFVMLAVSADQTSAKEVSQFVTAGGYTFPVLHDQSNEVIAKYGVRGIPTTYLLDKQGNIIVKQVGERDWGDKAIVKVITDLVNR